MIVKCSKCETKLKISDDKLTEAGIKIKCPKCTSVLKVRKPAAPKLEEAATPQEEPTEEPTAEEPAPEEPAEEEPAAEEPAPEEPAEEEPTTEEPTAEETPPEEEELSLEKEFGLPEEAPTEEPAEEEATEEEPAVEEFSLPEESLEQTEEASDKTEPSLEEEFGLDQEETADESENVLEGFDDSFSTESEEAPAEEESAEEFQLDTNFDFSGEPEEANDELKSNLDLAGDVSPGEPEEPAAEEPGYDLDEPSLSLRDEIEEAAGEEPAEEAPVITPDLSTDVGEPAAQPQPKSGRRPAASKEVTGYGVATRRSLPIIIPIILIIAVIGASFFAYKKFNAEKTEEVGTLTIYDENGKFLDNEKEGKVFVITGKVKNDFNVDRSFLKVKGMLFDENDNELASKTVFAGNIPTDLECRKLTITAIDELLNSKMGDELSNMNVSSGTSISFKIVFANINEDEVTQFKVVEAGSQLAFSR